MGVYGGNGAGSVCIRWPASEEQVEVHMVQTIPTLSVVVIQFVHPGVYRDVYPRECVGCYGCS